MATIFYEFLSLGKAHYWFLVNVTKLFSCQPYSCLYWYQLKADILHIPYVDILHPLLIYRLNEYVFRYKMYNPYIQCLIKATFIECFLEISAAYSISVAVLTFSCIAHLHLLKTTSWMSRKLKNLLLRL